MDPFEQASHDFLQHCAHERKFSRQSATKRTKHNDDDSASDSVVFMTTGDSVEGEQILFGVVAPGSSHLRRGAGFLNPMQFGQLRLVYR